MSITIKLTKKVAIITALLISVALMGACSSNSNKNSASSTSTTTVNRFNFGTVSYNPKATGIPSFYTPPNNLPNKPNGTLIRYQKVLGVPGVPSGATLYRIMFYSKTIYGKGIPESGYAIVPPTPAPAGGYTILSWAHGTTGAAPICAPSIFQSFVYLPPGLNNFITDNYLIAATDYEGLGTSVTIHPYLLGQSEGQGVLDAAIAAQQIPGVNASNKVFIYGHSQGGQSALFAGQLAPTYAPSLKILGVVAAAPATGFQFIVEVTPTDNSVLAFTFPMLWTWSQAYTNFPTSLIFTKEGMQIGSQYVGSVCDGNLGAILNNYPASDLFQPNASLNGVVQDFAMQNDPGSVPIPAPILIVQGTADTTVYPQFTDFNVQQTCKVTNDSLDYVLLSGANHSTIVSDEALPISQWMQAIAAGTPNNSTCGLNPDYISGPGTGVP